MHPSLQAGTACNRNKLLYDQLQDMLQLPYQSLLRHCNMALQWQTVTDIIAGLRAHSQCGMASAIYSTSHA